MSQASVYDFLKGVGRWVSKTDICAGIGLGEGSVTHNLSGLVARRLIVTKRVGSYRVGYYRVVRRG